MLEVGSQAPRFELPGCDGDTNATYDLSEYLEGGAVVLSFYPFDFTPVCTAELCRFRDSEWLMVIPDLDVFGISTDSAYAHRAVIEENDLPFPLLSDHDGSVSERYDVLYDELEGHPRVSKRAVAVVNETGTIRYAWEAEEWMTDPDIEAVHDAVRDLDGVRL